MANDQARPDWIKFEPARWMAGTAELDAMTEFVFFRLCLIAYEKADPVVSGSAKRNAMRCKVPLEVYEEAVELLSELEKVTVVEGGVLVHSTEGRLRDSIGRMSARQRGAAISRRRRELKFNGKKQAEIDLIISREFPDDQSDDLPRNKTDRQTDKTDREDTQGGVGEQFDLIPSEENSDPFEEAVAIWGEMAAKEGLPLVQSKSADRRKKLAERLKELGGIEGWKIAVHNVADSDFLCGRVKGKSWKASFDFLLQPKSLNKVMERSYQPYRSEGGATGGGSDTMKAIRGI